MSAVYYGTVLALDPIPRAELPAGPMGMLCFVEDMPSGPCLVFFDGAAWRECGSGAVVEKKAPPAAAPSDDGLAARVAALEARLMDHERVLQALVQSDDAIAARVEVLRAKVSDVESIVDIVLTVAKERARASDAHAS